MELTLYQNLNMLVEARKLISNKENWTQGAYAQDSKGRPVTGRSPYATCFCAFGAIDKIAEMAFNPVKSIRSQLEYLDLFTEDIGVIKYNDSHTHEEVLSLFDKAIEQVKKELNDTKV